MKYPKFILAAIAWLMALLSTGVVSAQEVRTYFVTDGVGSPIVATDANGKVVWTEDYLPYGERRTRAVASGSNERWFTNAPQNEDSGLVDLGNRQYDPVIGRFLGIDPVGPSADKPFGVNRYVYANNNPYRYVDPDGSASRVIVDASSKSITVKVPVVNWAVNGKALNRAVSSVSQSVLDDAGNTWAVSFLVTEGYLVDGDGNRFTNIVQYDRTLDRKHGSTRSTSTKTQYINYNPEAPGKVIAHEVAGHGSNLPDAYDTRTRESNPNMPNNLMNNDNFSSGGVKLDWGQIQQMTSPASGNDIIHGGEESKLRKLRDSIGF